MSMAVLVPSFDRYSFVWPIFFKMFKKYWKDCPYNVYLGSNFKTCGLDWVIDVKIGEDTTWGLKISKMLHQIKEDYVLFILEDFLIIDYVDNDVIANALEFIISRNIDCLGLHACPSPHPFVDNKDKPFGELLPGQPYRVNAQVSIWRKDALLKLLRPQFSPWDFECYGTQVAKKMDISIWGSYKPIIRYEQAIARGKWFKSIVDVCRNNSIDIDFTELGFFEPSPPTLTSRIKGKIKDVFLHFYR